MNFAQPLWIQHARKIYTSSALELMIVLFSTDYTILIHKVSFVYPNISALPFITVKFYHYLETSLQNKHVEFI